MLSLALPRDDAEVCKPDHCFLQAQCVRILPAREAGSCLACRVNDVRIPGERN